jgi:hypothetical protein
MTSTSTVEAYSIDRVRQARSSGATRAPTEAATHLLVPVGGGYTKLSSLGIVRESNNLPRRLAGPVGRSIDA